MSDPRFFSVDVGIVVTDVEASLRFYCEELGLSKVDAISLPGNRTLHVLRCGTSVVKLQEFHDGPPDGGPVGIASQAGLRYFTLWTDGLPELAARLKARGVVFARPLQEYQPGVFNAMIEDPDGNTIELSDNSRSLST